jgi:hypothetical protein
MDSSRDRGPGDELIQSALARARFLATGLSAGLLALLAISRLIDRSSSASGLAAPVALAGIISPVVAYRLYAWVQSSLRPEAGLRERCGAFLKANIIAFSVTAGVGLCGVVVFVFSGSIQALIGVVTHVIVAGALWPIPERMDRFLEAESSEREEG